MSDQTMEEKVEREIETFVERGVKHYAPAFPQDEEDLKDFLYVQYFGEFPSYLKRRKTRFRPHRDERTNKELLASTWRGVERPARPLKDNLEEVFAQHSEHYLNQTRERFLETIQEAIREEGKEEIFESAPIKRIGHLPGVQTFHQEHILPVYTNLRAQGYNRQDLITDSLGFHSVWKEREPKEVTEIITQSPILDLYRRLKERP